MNWDWILPVAIFAGFLVVWLVALPWLSAPPRERPSGASTAGEEPAGAGAGAGRERPAQPREGLWLP